jgi:hypothetical protein
MSFVDQFYALARQVRSVLAEFTLGEEHPSLACQRDRASSRPSRDAVTL